MRKVSTRNQLAAPSEPELCGSCHLVRRAQTFRNAHMPLREGAMSCSSRHPVHGIPVANNHDTVNDNCSAATPKARPFLWEHAPVTENCLDCHAPHGSTRAFMLTLNPPRLCQQCHIENRHPTEARLPQNKLVIGRACLQCHRTSRLEPPSGHASRAERQDWEGQHGGRSAARGLGLLAGCCGGSRWRGADVVDAELRWAAIKGDTSSSKFNEYRTSAGPS
jgi:predicted CXXCH cytochrome family protein